MVGINIGCGASPTLGYFNYDNSFSIRFSRAQWFLRILASTGVASGHQVDFAAVAKANGVRWARADRLPHRDSTVDVVYSSHMVEHLDHRETAAFLREAKRVLKPNGVLRLVLPDLRLRVDGYIQDGDADRLIGGLLMAREHPTGVLQRLKWAVVGDRNHAWMYDDRSAVRLLGEAGFLDPVSLPAGKTTIPEPGSLDLSERAGDSIYLEARAPA